MKPTPEKLDKIIEVVRQHQQAWITDIGKLNIVHQRARDVVAYPTHLNLFLLLEALEDAEKPGAGYHHGSLSDPRD